MDFYCSLLLQVPKDVPCLAVANSMNPELYASLGLSQAEKYTSIWVSETGETRARGREGSDDMLSRSVARRPGL